MPQKYYNVKDTAALLKATDEEVRGMLERRELYGYRDGADWKFKVEDIERMAKQRQSAPPAPLDEEGGDVLLSEVELGASESGMSGTVIGGDLKKASLDSDIKIAQSDVKLVESGIKLAGGGDLNKPDAPQRVKDEVQSKVSQFEELDLTLDQDIVLDGSSVTGSPAAKPSSGDSAVNLTGKVLDDDDMVLGGSGTGSDITIGGDSGISLVDPADSGLSLEDPLAPVAPGEESLELGEDDLLTLASDTATGAKLKGEDEFQLTPLEDLSDGDDSESGSQVIALDTEGDEGATMIASGSAMPSLLDEDLLAGAGMGMGAAPLISPVGENEIGLAAEPAGLAIGAPLMQPSVLLPEAPYTIWQILGLVCCTLVLIPVGMMMYDLMRNMWTWDSVHPINSGLMDWIVSLFEKT